MNRLKSKITGDGNIVSQGNTGTIHIYASAEPPPPKPEEPRGIGPYLVPFRTGNKFYVRNEGDDDAYNPRWTTSATGGEPSVMSSDVPIPNPMRPKIETMIGLDVRAFGSGATTIAVTWEDRNGNMSSNRLNV